MGTTVNSHCVKQRSAALKAVNSSLSNLVKETIKGYTEYKCL